MARLAELDVKDPPFGRQISAPSIFLGGWFFWGSNFRPLEDPGLPSWLVIAMFHDEYIISTLFFWK